MAGELTVSANVVIFVAPPAPTSCNKATANQHLSIDEIRRSHRATKGQHTKNIEELEKTASRKGKKGTRKKSVKQTSKEATPTSGDDENAIIRCICGLVDDDDEDGRPMVQCDKCEAWQHNECMGISLDPDDLPEQYFCEKCKPADHRELLAAIKRGEKPWEERIAQREREEEEKRNRRKKGGKKGKRGRPSDTKSEKTQDREPTAELQVEAPTDSVAADHKVEVGQKRKLLTELTIETKAIEEPVSLICLI